MNENSRKERKSLQMRFDKFPETDNVEEDFPLKTYRRNLFLSRLRPLHLLI